MKVFRVSSLLTLIGLVAVLQSVQAQPNLDNMFLDEDTDSFDPGLPIGAEFPEIRAIYDGNEINSIETFFGDKGAVFLPCARSTGDPSVERSSGSCRIT